MLTSIHISSSSTGILGSLYFFVQIFSTTACRFLPPNVHEGNPFSHPVVRFLSPCWSQYSTSSVWMSSSRLGKIFSRNPHPPSTESLSTRFGLCIWVDFPPSLGFNLYTHLFWSTFFAFDNSVSSYVWISCKESNSSYMALNHFRLWKSLFASSKLSSSNSLVSSKRSSSEIKESIKIFITCIGQDSNPVPPGN